MYTLRQVRDAVLNAEPPSTFPYGVELTPAVWARVRAEPQFATFLEKVRGLAGAAKREPTPPLPFSTFRLFEATGERFAYDAAYHGRRRRLNALALTALLDGDSAALETLQDLLWTICDEYTWCAPAHLPIGPGRALADRRPPERWVDLFASETANALAETLLLLGDRLDPWVRRRVRDNIEVRVFAPVFGDPASFGWESAPMNHSAVCAGAIGMAALVLEEDRERLAGMTARMVNAMMCYLEGFQDDGACDEGVSYWVYGFGHYVYFAEMLREYTGGRLDLLSLEKVRQIAAFPSGAGLGGGRFVNFSDAPDRVHLPLGLTSRLVGRLHPPVPELRAESLAEDDTPGRTWPYLGRTWSHLIRTLLWSDLSLLERPAESGSTFFPNLHWAVDRRVVAGLSVAFAAKGGHNDEGHNHNDLGHFLIDAGGEALLCDLGAGEYTRDYFHGDRYAHLHAASEGHSVPLVGGRPQRGGREHAAQVLNFDAQEGGFHFALELAGAYDLPGLRSLTRAFDWTVGASGAELTLTDAYAFGDIPQDIEEIFVSWLRPTLTPGRASWRGERAEVTLTYDADRLVPRLESLPSRSRGGDPVTVHRLHLRARSPGPSETYRFTFSLAPRAAETEPERAREVSA